MILFISCRNIKWKPERNKYTSHNLTIILCNFLHCWDTIHHNKYIISTKRARERIARDPKHILLGECDSSGMKGCLVTLCFLYTLCVCKTAPLFGGSTRFFCFFSLHTHVNTCSISFCCVSIKGEFNQQEQQCHPSSATHAAAVCDRQKPASPLGTPADKTNLTAKAKDWKVCRIFSQSQCTTMHFQTFFLSWCKDSTQHLLHDTFLTGKSLLTVSIDVSLNSKPPAVWTDAFPSRRCLTCAAFPISCTCISSANLHCYLNSGFRQVLGRIIWRSFMLPVYMMSILPISDLVLLTLPKMYLSGRPSDHLYICLELKRGFVQPLRSWVPVWKNGRTVLTTQVYLPLCRGPKAASITWWPCIHVIILGTMHLVLVPFHLRSDISWSI